MAALREVLVLTGAAGAGKSTAFSALAGHVSGICALDGDTIGSARPSWDYDDFWAFTIRVCRDILRNGLVPVACGIGLPSQVIPAADAVGINIDMLALVCGEQAVRQRIVQRGYGEAWRHPERHVAVDLALRSAVVTPPHQFSTYDTEIHGPEETTAAVIAWASEASRRITGR